MEQKSHPKKFFSKEEEREIIRAIQEAEKNTSGEIRVHLKNKIKHDPLSEAAGIFNALGMHKTKQRNGCLILISLKSKKVAVIGDKGIHEKVGNNFWADVVKIIIDGFRDGRYTPSLARGILLVGEKLKAYFPHESGDVNELPDDISGNNP